jgi:hypothetical protein
MESARARKTREAQRMRLYLSSFDLGDRPDELVALTSSARRAAIIVNALDNHPAGRAVWLKKQTDKLVGRPGTLALGPTWMRMPWARQQGREGGAHATDAPHQHESAELVGSWYPSKFACSRHDIARNLYIQEQERHKHLQSSCRRPCAALRLTCCHAFC